MVDIPDEVMPMLAAHLARLPVREALVFPSPHRRGAYRARTYQEWIKRLCKSAGVTPLPVHSTRHSYATLALDAGVPLKEVSEQLGHANVAITASIYSHNTKQRSRRAAAALGSVLVSRLPDRIEGARAKLGSDKLH